MSQASMMEAATLTGPGQTEIVRMPLPEPGPGQIRVRLEGCGVCASNLTPWAGSEWMQYPTPPGGLGHEGWGLIDALGEGVDGLSVGQRVATLGEASYAGFELVDAASAIPLPASFADRPFPGEALGCGVNTASNGRSIWRENWSRKADGSSLPATTRTGCAR